MELAAEFPHPPRQRSRKGVATRELIFTHPPIPLGLSLSVSNFCRYSRAYIHPPPNPTWSESLCFQLREIKRDGTTDKWSP